MKNKLKVIICSVLCAAMLVPTLVSCANNDDTGAQVTKPLNNGENSGDAPEFVEADFDGADFKFLHYGSTADDYADEYIWSENFTGGAIGDAVIDRNQLVEDRYNITISAEECGPMGEATTRMQAGQCDFDVIYEWGIRSKSAALDGMLYDMAELDIDMENSWWVPSANESLTVNDRLYVFTNMVTMNALSWSQMVYFNKMLMDKLNYAYPYDYVDNNTWTYDLVIKMCVGAEEDINGDGTIGVEDQIGGYSGEQIMSALCSEPLTKKNDDGSYSVITFTESMVASYNKYKNQVDGIEYVTYEDVWASGVDLSQFESKYIGARFYLFGEDHMLFMPGSIDMTKELVNMKSNYGVVPCPVKNEGDAYSTGIDSNAPMFSMPIQLEDPEMAAIVFDYMAYESENLLLPAFYETTIKTKRMEDPRDYEMLDIVRDSVEYDWTGVYMWDSDLSKMRSDMITSGNFSSVAKRMEAKCQSQIDEVITKIAEIDA